jgi:hypothetical protein
MTEPSTQHIDALAAIIRRVNGNNQASAAALAEMILAHPSSQWGPTPAPAPAAFPGISDSLIRMLILEVQHQLATSTESMLNGRPFDPVPEVRAQLTEILHLAAADAVAGGAPAMPALPEKAALVVAALGLGDSFAIRQGLARALKAAPRIDTIPWWEATKVLEITP